MRNPFRIVSVPAVAILVSCAPMDPAPAPDADPTTAFVGVNVIPMDSERVLDDQTVLVAGDRIVAVGPSGEVAVPDGATVVEGGGRYLMPGLAEMHGHVPRPDAPRQLTEDVLFLFVANGVTTVRGMQGADGQLDLRADVESGRVAGPNLYLAGPGFSGNSVSSPEEAVQRVRDQAAEGWHLLKVQGGLDVATFDAMAETAREVGIRFGGHVPADVGIAHAIDAGQETFEHLDGYEAYVVGDDGVVDEDRLDDIIGRTIEAGAWAVPTMALWEALRGTLPLETVQGYEESRYMPPDMVAQWSGRVESVRSGDAFDADAAERQIASRMRILEALHASGTRILLGTDAPQVFSVPGFSVHREMERMIAAGMSPYEVIASGTRSVGEYFANEDDFGTIAEGQRADLVLTDANPLDDLGAIRGPDGVMVAGRWYPGAEIDARLKAIVAANAE